jgi:glycosyltransferase involved in cell wall biosynthesis
VGLLTADLSPSHGWGQHSLNLVKALHRAGARLTVMASRNSPVVEGIEVHSLLPAVNPFEDRMIFKMALQVPKTRQLLRECEVIHTAIEPYAPLAAWIAGRRPFFVTAHGSYIRLAEVRRWPISEVYRRAFVQARIICVSRYTEHVAQQALPGARTVVVNNGVDYERFAGQLPASSRQPPGARATLLSRYSPLILSVGAVKARKGTLELVEAIARVRERIADVQCVIIGSLTAEPDYVARVKATVQQLGLSDTVYLLGHVPDETLLDWYRRANLFVLPSINDEWKFEGYGLVYLEASAAGLPVIGTTECGAEDAIDEGITGLLVPQSQIAERLPGAMIRILSDSELATRMGQAGREKASRQTWDQVAAQILALYNKAGGGD